MSKILELREKRAKAWEAAKAFLDAKRTQEGFVSAEDAATYDKMEKDVVNLGKEIETGKTGCYRCRTFQGNKHTDHQQAGCKDWR